MLTDSTVPLLVISLGNYSNDEKYIILYNITSVSQVAK